MPTVMTFYSIKQWKAGKSHSDLAQCVAFY